MEGGKGKSEKVAGGGGGKGGVGDGGKSRGGNRGYGGADPKRGVSVPKKNNGVRGVVGGA